MIQFFLPDNTVLNNFAIIGRMDLLETLLRGKGAWCATIASECAKGARVPGREAMSSARHFLGDPWYPETGAERVSVQLIQDELLGPGDPRTAHLGEAETIALVESRGAAARFITDDKDARRVAEAHQIGVVTTFDLFRLALKVRLVTPAEVYGFAQALHREQRGVPVSLLGGVTAVEVWAAAAA
ncbi:hypothetical protein [Myceligenerans crystallogenes]|uniref:PIN domain-containing protein n=1 Tax=Myceligenerans crystallogenes TaxID=316335 RepID=A0ABP4ZFV2_9MICO